MEMTYNGVNPRTMGNIKVLNVKCGIVAKSDRKSVVYRGMERAYTQIPTLREITVEMLVRASSKAQLYRQLERVGDWLSPTAHCKLAFSNNPDVFYWATATLVDEPEYRGFSARFEVKFTCKDYKRYSVLTGEPIDDADYTDTQNFTFAGKHCLNDMGCVFVEKSRNIVPALDLNTYIVSGVDGSVRIDNPNRSSGARLNEITLEGTLYFVGTADSGLMSGAEINQRMRDVALWLTLAGRDKIIFDADADYYWEAEVADAQTISFNDWTNGAIALKMRLQPVGIYDTVIEQSYDAECVPHVEDEQAEMPYADIDIGSLYEGIVYDTPLEVLVRDDDYNQPLTHIEISVWNGNLEQIIAFDESIANGDPENLLEGGDVLTVNAETFTADADGRDAIPYIGGRAKTLHFPILYVNHSEEKLRIRVEKAGDDWFTATHQVHVVLRFRPRVL